MLTLIKNADVYAPEHIGKKDILIASKFGITDPAGIASMILPIQLLASMGRGVSPISAVVVAVGGSTNTNTMDMVKRTMIPILTTAVVMIIFNFIVNW